VLGGGVAEFGADLRGSFFCILQVLPGKQEALFGEIAEDGSVEEFFEPAFELVFVQADGARDLGKIRWAIKPVVDEVSDGYQFLFIGGHFYELWFLLHGAVAGFRAEDEQFDAFGEEEELLKVSFVGMVDDLVDHLLDSGVHRAPFVGEDGAFTLKDVVGEAFEQVAGIVREPQEGVARELDPKGFEFQGAGFHGHVEIF